MMSPDWRVTEPQVGASAPVSNLNSVVFPVPLRPTMPHRSPAPTVKVTSRNSVVAPKSTPAPPTEICVMPAHSPPDSASWGEPALPCVFRQSDRPRIAVPHEWHLEQQRLVDQDRQPAFVAVARRPEPE